jgi:hypothetical protein
MVLTVLHRPVDVAVGNGKVPEIDVGGVGSC